MSDLLLHLKELVEEHTASLPMVTYRRMFGCDGYFAKGSIFALVWKTGRIGARLPEPGAFAEAMAMEGASPWKPGAMKNGMSHWVLLGEEVHDDTDALADWLRRAHQLNFNGAGLKKNQPKPAKKKAVAKKRAAPKKRSR